MTSIDADQMPSLPAPNLDRLMTDLLTLATFVEPGTPGTTRRFPSQAHVAGRRWLRQRMDEAGLQATIDAAGNLLGYRPGRADLPPIMIGSHSDTVYGGGRYDGALGVLAALEAARTLAEANVSLRHPLIVADYLAEEATDFGVSCIGSRAMSGGFDPAWLLLLIGFALLFYLLRGLVLDVVILLQCLSITLSHFGNDKLWLGGRGIIGMVLLTFIYFLMALMTLLVIYSWFGLFGRAAEWAGRRIYPIIYSFDPTGRLGPLVFLLGFFLLGFVAAAVQAAFF